VTGTRLSQREKLCEGASHGEACVSSGRGLFECRGTGLPVNHILVALGVPLREGTDLNGKRPDQS